MLRLLTVLLILAAALVSGTSFGRGETLAQELNPRVWLAHLSIASIPFVLLVLASFSTRQYVVADLTSLLFACLVLTIDVYDLCVSESFRTGGRISTPLFDFSLVAVIETVLAGLSLLFVWCLRWIITPAVVDEPRPGRLVTRRRRPNDRNRRAAGFIPAELVEAVSSNLPGGDEPRRSSRKYGNGFPCSMPST